MNTTLLLYFFFFFKQKTAYEIKECDWSSDVCSSDLGAIADVGQAAVGVPAEWPLVDLAVAGAIEQRAPRLELVDAVGRFLGVDLRHAPVVVHLAAAHRVAEMHAPVVFRKHVAERRGGARQRVSGRQL